MTTPPPSIRRSLFGGACISLQPLVLNAISLPVMAYIIRTLGPTAYGQWMMATSLIATITVLSNLGLRGAFVRQLAAHPESTEPELAEQLGLRLTLGTLAGVTALALAIGLGYPGIVLTCTGLCGVALVLNTVASTLVDVLQSRHRLVVVAGSNAVSGLALTAASVVAIGWGTGPVGLGIAYLVGPVISVATLSAAVRRQHLRVGVRLNLSRFKALVIRSRFFTAQQVLASLSANVDSLVLPRLFGASTFGFVSAGMLPVSRLGVIPDGLCTAAYPLLVQGFGRDRATGRRLAFRYASLIVAVCVPVALGVTLLAGPISAILFPADPLTCRIVMTISVWALPLMGLESALGFSGNAAGHDAEQARAYLGGAAGATLLTLVLIARFGWLGAAWAVPARHLVRCGFLLACQFRVGRAGAAMASCPAIQV